MQSRLSPPLTERSRRYLDTRLPGQTYGGGYPNALAQSDDGKTLYVANASSDAVAVFQIGTQADYRAGYFIPTEWYPTAIAIHDGELLIATGKGQSTGRTPDGKPTRSILTSRDTLTSHP